MSDTVTGTKRPAEEDGPATPPSPKRTRREGDESSAPPSDSAPDSGPGPADEKADAFFRLPVSDEDAKKFPWLAICMEKNKSEWEGNAGVIESMKKIPRSEAEALSTLQGTMPSDEFKEKVKFLVRGDKWKNIGAKLQSVAFTLRRVAPAKEGGSTKEGDGDTLANPAAESVLHEKHFEVPTSILNMLPAVFRTNMLPTDEGTEYNLVQTEPMEILEALQDDTNAPVDFELLFIYLHSMDVATWVELVPRLFPVADAKDISYYPQNIVLSYSR